LPGLRKPESLPGLRKLGISSVRDDSQRKVAMLRLDRKDAGTHAVPFSQKRIHLRHLAGKRGGWRHLDVGVVLARLA